MPDEEFIKAYAAGMVPRRAFVRRLVAGGVSLAAALAYGNALAPGVALAEPHRLSPGQLDHHRNHHDSTVRVSPATPSAVEVMPNFTG